MVKIPVIELKNFISKAKDIKSDSIIPVLKQFVLLTCDGDVVTITKTNGAAFIICQLDGCKFKKNFKLLLDEKIMEASVSAATGETMAISFKDMKHPSDPGRAAKEVSFDDGVDVDVQCFAEDEKLYAEIPKGDKGSMIQMDQDMIESLFLASKCCAIPKENKQYIHYVHLKPTGKKSSYIIGMNNHIMYYKSYKKPLPDLVLELTNVAALRGLTDINFYTGSNYNFFDAGLTLYGFIQTEVKSPDFSLITSKLDTSKLFTMNRKDLLRFCQLAIRTNPMTIVDPCYLKQQDDTHILFDYEYAQTNLKAKMVFEVKKNKKYAVQKFTFNPNEMLTMLENLPVEHIQISGPIAGNLFITTEEDKDYIGIIREVVLPNEAKTVADANK